jgi:hypothetical protein
LSVARFTVQLPEAPNGVTSFTAPFRLKVHLEASVKAVLASVTLAPIVLVTHSLLSGPRHFCEALHLHRLVIHADRSTSSLSCLAYALYGLSGFARLPRYCRPHGFYRYSEICTLSSFLLSGG